MKGQPKKKLKEGLRPFNRRELSLMISAIENRDSQSMRELKKCFHSRSLEKTICFTGPAGVGKSSLISRLAQIKSRDQKIAWLACDPSSIQTGGSVLGDRIRLSGSEISSNLFVRSLATRSTEAFPHCIRDIEIFLEPYFDEVWVETAGSGQTQQEVGQISALTVLVLQPETGDEIQWMKSGMREVGDLFVVHKADLKGTDLMMQSLIEQGITPQKIFKISSKNQEGLDRFLDELARFRKSLVTSAKLKSLHLSHAHDHFFESRMKNIEAEFQKKKAKLTLNPYNL